MRFLLTLFFILQCFISVGQTQAEMNIRAMEKCKAADKELKKVYNAIIEKNAADTVFINNVEKSQKLWKEFLKAELQMKYPDREEGYYGSIQALCLFSYQEELTRERIAKLKQWLEGVEEGDGCNGTLPIKH